MKVVIVAPHPDDEVLGVGGTIHRLGKESVSTSSSGSVPSGAFHPPPNPPTILNLVDQVAHLSVERESLVKTLRLCLVSAGRVLAS